MPRHTPEEGGVIEFSVTDMGPGLKDEVIARLYEAFFSTKAEGLGIGLSLCRSIVESHRGRIKAPEPLQWRRRRRAAVSPSRCRSKSGPPRPSPAAAGDATPPSVTST